MGSIVTRKQKFLRLYTRNESEKERVGAGCIVLRKYHPPVPLEEKLEFISDWNNGVSLKDLYSKYKVDPSMRAQRWCLGRRDRYELQFEKAGGENTKWKDQEDEMVVNLNYYSTPQCDIAAILRRTIDAVRHRERFLCTPRRIKKCVLCYQRIIERVEQAQICISCVMEYRPYFRLIKKGDVYIIGNRDTLWHDRFVWLALHRPFSFIVKDRDSGRIIEREHDSTQDISRYGEDMIDEYDLLYEEGVEFSDMKAELFDRLYEEHK